MFLERMTGERERITKNAMVRACLDALREVEIDTANVPDEEERNVSDLVVERVGWGRDDGRLIFE